MLAPNDVKPGDIAFNPTDQGQVDAKIAELAALPPLEYEQRRSQEAEALCVRVSFLDRLVKAERDGGDGGDDELFPEIEPWPHPVDGAGLLRELVATVKRFCVLPEHSAELMGFWVMHAWAHDAASISPILSFVSPTKRCGKTTALSVIGALVPKSLHTTNATSASLFRTIEKYTPTLLIDEADTFLTGNDELRGVLNGGHNRLSAFVIRLVGEDHEPRRFKTWAPKCIAMIGDLPDTLADRSIIVHLRRKQVGETVDGFRADRVDDFEHLRRKAARWADDNMHRLRAADPQPPPELDDRAQDNARALVAIADVAGGEWPETARAALVGSYARQKTDEPESTGIQLLRDIVEVFTAKRVDRMSSTGLLDALCELEEAPWLEWRGGRPISTRGIAKLLKPYGVTPRRNIASNYYAMTDMRDAIGRYLSNTHLKKPP